jgi:hypothetical protein
VHSTSPKKPRHPLLCILGNDSIRRTKWAVNALVALSQANPVGFRVAMSGMQMDAVCYRLFASLQSSKLHVPHGQFACVSGANEPVRNFVCEAYHAV